MGQDQSAGGTTVTAGDESEKLREQIEETRQELGDTVEALAAKTDVKAQAKRRLDETRSTLSKRADELLERARRASPDGANEAATQTLEKVRANPGRTAAAAAFGLLLVRRITRRRRKRRCST